MARRRRGFRGMSKVKAMLDRLPESFRRQMVGVLEGAGRGLKSAMRARAPTRTGALQQGIDYKVYPKSLRMVVGLLLTRRGRSNLFYGRIQDLGRKAQVVVVSRLRRGQRGAWTARIAGGTARTSRKPADLSTATYAMHVRAMAPKRFITGRKPELQNAMRNGLKGIFARAMRSAGGSGE